MPEVVLIQLTLLIMSMWLLETCRELEQTNIRKRIVHHVGYLQRFIKLSSRAMLFCVDKDTDVMEVIIAFHNFANTPNKDKCFGKKSCIHCQLEFWRGTSFGSFIEHCTMDKVHGHNNAEKRDGF